MTDDQERETMTDFLVENHGFEPDGLDDLADEEIEEIAETHFELHGVVVDYILNKSDAFDRADLTKTPYGVLCWIESTLEPATEERGVY